MIQNGNLYNMTVLHLNTSHKSTHLNPKILPAGDGDGEYDGDDGMDGV